MQSDPWWSFAMAINVYMVFFMQFNLSAFRRYIWLYCLICYGLPAIPAFVFLFLRSPRGMIYGDAVVSDPGFGVLSSHLNDFCVHNNNSSGAGSPQSGMCSASTPTTSPSGCAASCLPSSTSPWATMCSTCAISSATCPSAIRERTRRMTLRMCGILPRRCVTCVSFLARPSDNRAMRHVIPLPLCFFPPPVVQNGRCVVHMRPYPPLVDSHRADILKRSTGSLLSPMSAGGCNVGQSIVRPT